MAKLDFDALNAMQRYLQFAVFRAIPGALGSEREELTKEAQQFFADLEAEGKVVVRGIYDNTGIRADADFMIWWHAEHFEELQKALADFRRTTTLGQLLEVAWLGNGEDPEAWITVYPFVRSYEWYLLDPQERRRILANHGKAARDFADVRANTVEAFTLGDYEWMLAFEAPTLARIEELMHTMRYTEARLHVREEIPFHTGRRVEDISEIIKVLP